MSWLGDGLHASHATDCSQGACQFASSFLCLASHCGIGGVKFLCMDRRCVRSRVYKREPP